jgi:hypothetical protein
MENNTYSKYIDIRYSNTKWLSYSLNLNINKLSDLFDKYNKSNKYNKFDKYDINIYPKLIFYYKKK